MPTVRRAGTASAARTHNALDGVHVADMARLYASEEPERFRDMARLLLTTREFAMIASQLKAQEEREDAEILASSLAMLDGYADSDQRRARKAAEAERLRAHAQRMRQIWDRGERRRAAVKAKKLGRRAPGIRMVAPRTREQSHTPKPVAARAGASSASSGSDPGDPEPAPSATPARRGRGLSQFRWPSNPAVVA